MQKSILVLLSIMTGSVILAQQGDKGFLLTGSVIYQQTVKLDIQLEGDAAQFARSLPKERKSEKILHFTEDATMYRNHHTDDPEEAVDMDGGGTMMIKMVEPDNKVYTDLEHKLQIEQKEFMSRVFLIETELEKGAWKLTGGQKTILEYPCQEAVTEEDGKTVLAWFTPGIAVPAGPGKFGNLPGLVLAVDINDGEHTLQALSIELKPVDKELLERPRKGKKVTAEEYRAIVEEKMKEMGAEGGGGGAHTIVVKIRQ